jgi:hypothetical protein
MRKALKPVIDIGIGIVLEMTISAGYLEWFKPYLPIAWLLIATHLTWEILHYDTVLGLAKWLWVRFGGRGRMVSYIAVGILGAAIFVIYWWGIQKIFAKRAATESSESKSSADEARSSQPSTKTPSFIFVFGAPLGDDDSSSWIMMIKHYAPNPAYNCDIIFYDNDRKNIEHQWLVGHPNSPYPPPGLAGESQKRISVAEAGPEGSSGSFTWNPLNPNSQHYTVSISCRDGVFAEKWEVTRVDGILRSMIAIEHGPQWIKNNPNLSPVVFRCVDPEFVTASLATELPKSSPGKVVHPGWKPKHRFEVPAAIIDPNGNVQVVSGVKLPDGSTLTDFGCWNILTRHFGD